MVHVRSGQITKEGLKCPIRRTLAQRSNFVPGVAWGYHPWRALSLSVLSGSPLPLSAEATLFTALARPQAGEDWLDVGTSSGFYAGLLARAGANVLAIDISLSMLNVARARASRAPEAAGQIDWALIDIEENHLPSARFAGITLGATLNETARPWQALSEVQRLLAPGGRLWLMYLARSGGARQTLLSSLGGLAFADPAQVRRALQECDLIAANRRQNVMFELYMRR